jgi:upstream activation factor subunit UAF30
VKNASSLLASLVWEAHDRFRRSAALIRSQAQILNSPFGEPNMATAKKKAPAKKSAAKNTAAKKTAAKKSPATTAAKKAPAKKAAKSAAPKTARKPNAAFMKPMNVSADLGAVIGSAPMPRTEVTKKIWEYIKKNKLQDAVNKRMINADDKLKKVFGGKAKVSMFEMTKLVSDHLK